MSHSIGRLAASLASALALSLAAASHAQDACRADFDGDGSVGASDLTILLNAWGTCDGCVADVDRSGTVDGADLTVLLGFWSGACAPLEWATVLEFAPDPAVVTNVVLRNAIIATGLPWRVRDNASDIEMLLVPPGSFNMGCSPSIQFDCFFEENPVHMVALTSPFYIGRYEVTQAQWTAVMGSNPSFFKSASAQVPAAQVPNRPVEQVAWTTAQGFLSATGLRLPTEAEWEFAYRAGTTTAFHSGPGFSTGTNNDTLAGNIAWLFSNAAAQTRPVGGKAANALGLHDMAGNVWEWVNDWSQANYYAWSPAVNPPGPAIGAFRVLRGGSWSVISTAVRSSFREAFTPGSAFSNLGFRVARTP
jgi:formylglycine-generating enzyme required for sulfatase activity